MRSTILVLATSAVLVIVGIRLGAGRAAPGGGGR
jgi:hypothetical protein